MQHVTDNNSDDSTATFTRLTALGTRTPDKWSMPLLQPFDFGRRHANEAWSDVPPGQEDSRCASISRTHLRLRPDGCGGVLLECRGQRVRIRREHAPPIVVLRNQPAVRITPGCELDLTIKSGPPGEASADMLLRLPVHRWASPLADSELYFSLALTAEPSAQAAAAADASAAAAVAASVAAVAAPSSDEVGPARVRPRDDSESGAAPPAKRQDVHALSSPSASSVDAYAPAALLERLVAALPLAERRQKEPHEDPN